MSSTNSRAATATRNATRDVSDSALARADALSPLALCHHTLCMALSTRTYFTLGGTAHF